MVDAPEKKIKISLYINESDKKLIQASAKGSWRSLSQYCLYLIYTGLQVEADERKKVLTQNNAQP